MAPMKRLSALAISVLALGACQNPSETREKAPLRSNPNTVGRPGDAPPPTAAPGGMPSPAGSNTPGLTGTVVETMDAGGYTYVQLDAGAKGKVWVAGPSTQVRVGDTVGFSGGMLMEGFRSNSLDRTFDAIYFANAFRVEGGSGAAAGGADGTGAASKPADGPSTQPSGDVEVKKAEGGHTVAEVFAQADALAGSEVVLRGQVVKFNAGIMGKNWLHVRDGTGEAGSNDLTVTTDASAQVGDVVVVRGTVATNKDFGAGYSYPVIVEDASLTK